MDREHEGPHHVDGPESCFGCRVKGFSISPYAMPSRLHPHIPPRQPNPSWEKGVAKDGRGVPFLNKSGGLMSVKEFSENRHSIEAHKRRLHNSPVPLQ